MSLSSAAESRPTAPPPDEPGAGDPQAALDAVRHQAAGCQACPLWEIGTQTVFGNGPAGARLMFVGEAPGYQEDKQGLPFVGPAGALFSQALEQAGLRRDAVYVTNVVKHRPWVEGGRQGKNRPPKQSEVTACRPWLEQELAIIRPLIVACLGAIAAKWLLGKEFKLTQQRGQWLTSPYAPHVLATVHPSYVLIQPPESHERWREVFFADVRAVAEKLRALQPGP
ncbi:MAG TPA: UdgX family uracil-DNA binding protein [Chloroflexota bacterium]|jgi:uracil-DNA glycosylase family protein|nr:UdgX family uracil-DNA binding protein [Chloroflexota bacterium]